MPEPEPTATVAIVNTPEPTPTMTPVPEPIILSGSGDSVEEIVKPSIPALARIQYTGSGNFAVWNYDKDGKKIDLLVNVVGNYTGVVPLDFLDNEHTHRFEIQSEGQWQIQVLSITEIRRIDIPGVFSGNGDDVVFLNGDDPDLLKIDASMATSNFAVWKYGNNRDLLVNEIAPYTGTVIAGKDAIILVIQSKGEWTIEVTTE
jgi:hypothetical protein